MSIVAVDGPLGEHDGSSFASVMMLVVLYGEVRV
jgi:hypothetical protein